MTITTSHKKNTAKAYQLHVQFVATTMSSKLVGLPYIPKSTLSSYGESIGESISKAINSVWSVAATSEML